MNIAIIFLLIFTSLNCLADNTQRLSVIAKIKTQGSAFVLQRSSDNTMIPSVLKDQKLMEVINKLNPGDETIIEGHITYHMSLNETQNQYSPIFVIESIKPVSLRLLGQQNEKAPEIESSKRFQLSNEKVYSPMGIPVTTEVASSITLTTSALLLQSLTAGPNEPGTHQKLNSGMIIFAGALATGVFIYENIAESLKKNRRN